MDEYRTFIHLLFIGVIALFPVVNPVGTAFILNPYFQNLTRAERRKSVKKIALYAFCICTVALFAGHWILELFGISIPVIQVAGGILICKMGWELLSSTGSTAEHQANANERPVYDRLQDQLFYPITFPVTTGAGTISVLFTLGAQSEDGNAAHYLLNTSALLAAIIVMCLLVYIFYMNTETLIRYMGPKGENVVNRISAFLIFCVGLQIAFGGIRALVKDMI